VDAEIAGDVDGAQRLGRHSAEYGTSFTTLQQYTRV
jgi:hypothetical protein